MSAATPAPYPQLEAHVLSQSGHTSISVWPMPPSCSAGPLPPSSLVDHALAGHGTQRSHWFLASLPTPFLKGLVVPEPPARKATQRARSLRTDGGASR